MDRSVVCLSHRGVAVDRHRRGAVCSVFCQTRVRVAEMCWVVYCDEAEEKAAAGEERGVLREDVELDRAEAGARNLERPRILGQLGGLGGWKWSSGGSRYARNSDSINATTTTATVRQKNWMQPSQALTSASVGSGRQWALTLLAKRKEQG